MKAESTLRALLVMMAIGMIGFSAAPAQAAYSSCPNNRFCIFQHADGGGRHIAFEKGTDNLARVFNGRMNDQTSAVWNRTGKPWCVYEHKNRGGHRWMIGSGFKGAIHTHTSPDGFRWNDKISSVRPAHRIIPPRNPSAAHWRC